MRVGRPTLRWAAVPAAAGIDAVEDELYNTADKANCRGDVGEHDIPGVPVVAIEVREVPAGQHDNEARAPEGSVHVCEQLVDDADPPERCAAREDAGNDHEGTPEEAVYPERADHAPEDEGGDREDDQAHQDDPVDNGPEIASHWSGIPRRRAEREVSTPIKLPVIEIHIKFRIAHLGRIV